jgi:hypothetical protein
MIISNVRVKGKELYIAELNSVIRTSFVRHLGYNVTHSVVPTSYLKARVLFCFVRYTKEYIQIFNDIDSHSF